MTQRDPSLRPNAREALRQWQTIRMSLSDLSQQWRLRSRQKYWVKKVVYNSFAINRISWYLSRALIGWIMHLQAWMDMSHEFSYIWCSSWLFLPITCSATQAGLIVTHGQLIVPMPSNYVILSNRHVVRCARPFCPSAPIEWNFEPVNMRTLQLPLMRLWIMTFQSRLVWQFWCCLFW